EAGGATEPGDDDPRPAPGAVPDAKVLGDVRDAAGPVSGRHAGDGAGQEVPAGVADRAAARPGGAGARRGRQCAEMPALRAGDAASVAACGYASAHSRKRHESFLEQPHLTHLTPAPRPAAPGLLIPA